MLRSLLTQRFEEGSVTCDWVESSRIETEAARRSIEAEWARLRDRPGLDLFDGPMCRLESFHVKGARLELGLSPTSYKVFAGTNLYGPRDLPRDTLANPLGVSPALETGDGFLLVGRRNGRVAYYPHRLHPFSGSLEPTTDGSAVDIFANCRRELFEELHLESDEVPFVTLLGIVEDEAIRHPELILHARTTLGRQAVLSRLAEDEHDDAVAIPATLDAVKAAMADERFTPVGRAALELWALAQARGL